MKNDWKKIFASSLKRNGGTSSKTRAMVQVLAGALTATAVLWNPAIAQVKRAPAVGADYLGRPRLRRQCRWRLQRRQGQGIRTRGKDRQDRLAVLSRPQGRGRRGPRTLGQVAARHVDLEQRARHTHQRRRDVDLDTLDIKNGLLYVPGGNPAPDFASGEREGRISLPTETAHPASDHGRQGRARRRMGTSTATISPPTTCSTACR